MRILLVGVGQSGAVSKCLLTRTPDGVTFKGRLGIYPYRDMKAAIRAKLDTAAALWACTGQNRPSPPL